MSTEGAAGGRDLKRAVAFLTLDKVQRTPESARVSFLEGKGFSAEEIKEAQRQANEILQKRKEEAAAGSSTTFGGGGAVSSTAAAAESAEARTRRLKGQIIKLVREVQQLPGGHDVDAAGLERIQSLAVKGNASLLDYMEICVNDLGMGVKEDEDKVKLVKELIAKAESYV